MKMGFTGTQLGMSPYQRSAFKLLVGYIMQRPDTIWEFHHGDCVGSDEEACLEVDVVSDMRMRIVAHPPTNPKKRAYARSDETREKKEYLERNKDIVLETDIIVATPSTVEQHVRSGTWSTVRYAYSWNKPVMLLLPVDR
jgi:hypothetical protein